MLLPIFCGMPIRDYCTKIMGVNKDELENELNNIYTGMVAAGSKVIKAKVQLSTLSQHLPSNLLKRLVLILKPFFRSLLILTESMALRTFVPVFFVRLAAVA